MAFTLVRSKFAASADTNSVTTAAADFTGVDLLVVLASSYQAATAPTLSDSKSNTWTGLTLQETAGAGRARLFYATSVILDAAQTFTLTGTGTYCAIGVLGFSGANTTAPYDTPHQNGVDFAGVGTVQPGSITGSVPSVLHVTGLGWTSTNTLSINSSFNLVTGQIDFNGGVNIGVAAAWKETSGAENPTWTATGSMTGGVVIASFLPSGGGGGGGGTGSGSLLLMLGT